MNSLFILANVVLILTIAISSNATLGVDMSLQQCQTATIDHWKCLKRSGFDFAIIEVWNGGYQFNNNIKKCIDDAKEAGFLHVDVYAFLCPNCKGNYPAGEAIERMLYSLHKMNATYGGLWLDIEQCNGCWYSDLSLNTRYVYNASKSAEEYFSKEGKNRQVGIYSSVYEWKSTVETNDISRKLSELQLWYAHYDNNPSFDDTWAFTFNGWTKPSIKQYNDHGPSCGVDVDVNYY